jgi:hypothetical protein
MVSEAVEVWFKVERDSEDYPKSQEWEQLWTWPTANGFRIDNIPFFVKGIALGDIVSAKKTKDGWFQFERVLTSSGHSTFRIWLADHVECERVPVIIEELQRLGARAETTLHRLIAIDTPPECETQVWEYLQRGLHEGSWEIQVGFSPD